MYKARRRLNIGSSNKIKRSGISNQGALDTLRKRYYDNKLVSSSIENTNSGPVVKKKARTPIPTIGVRETSTLNSSNSLNSPTSTFSSGFIVAATASSSIPPLTKDADYGQTSNGDTSVFLVIGLIVSITVVGCILACLYRRRRMRKLIASRSLRNTSVGSRIVMNRTNEQKLPGSTPMTEYLTEDPNAMDDKIGVALEIREEKEEPSDGSLIFSKMKLPPTTALPPLPTEVHLPFATHQRSVSVPNVATYGRTDITDIERTKSLSQNAKKSPRFNCPPPPVHAPNFPIPYHSTTAPTTPTTSTITTPTTSTITTSVTTSIITKSTSTSTSPTLCDHKFNSIASSSKWVGDENDLSPYSVSPPTTTRKSSEIFANYWPKPPQTIPTTSKSNVHYGDDRKTTRDEEEFTADNSGLISLPKVEKINKNLSINFEQLSIFKGRVSPGKEYSVDVDGVGVGGKDGFRNQGINKPQKSGNDKTMKDGDENVKVIVINNNDAGRLYNEYI